MLPDSGLGMELAQVIAATRGWRLTRDQTMDPKLAILFMLVGAIIVLSHVTDEALGRMRRQLVKLRWREFMSARRKA